MNIHLRSDSSGAIGVASRRGLQRLRHLGRAISGVAGGDRQQRTFESAKVPGPESVADANHETCRQTFARVLPIKDGRHRDPETVP